MASVFGLIGYGPVESLHFFLSRFIESNSITDPDKELEKVWISHKTHENLKKFKLSLNGDHFNVECKRIHSNPFTEFDFVFKENSQNHFSSQRILEAILTKMHCCLAQYVISECLVLYNWGINSFELVFDNEEFCMRLLRYQNNCGWKRVLSKDEDFRKWRMILTSQKKNVKAKRMRRNSCDLFEEEERKMLSRKDKKRRKCSNNYELERIYKECDKPLREMGRGNKKSVDVFNKDKILYDMKQRTWPTNHALSASTADELLSVIMGMEMKGKANYGNGPSRHAGDEWKSLKRILDLFLKNHKKLLILDGYGRLLKRHLKKRGFIKRKEDNKTLKPIPGSIVLSYIAIILHKVVPFEFFGSNRVRKKFFREISMIISGGKKENFILKPLIQTLSDVKNKLTWIREIQGCEVAGRIISKIVKWMLLDYLFLILKNNFYITDVGSSGYRLYYYRKGDIERSVSRWVKSQIQLENLRYVKGDLEHWTSVERKWLETGKVELNGNDREMNMPGSSEHIFPVANVRFLPKSIDNSDLRIITSYGIKKTILRSGDRYGKKMVQYFMDRHVKRLLMFQKVKLLLQFLTDKYGTGIKPFPNNPKLEMAWVKALRLKEVHGKLYYVKADVRDAFGSVLPGLLGAIIDKKLRPKSNQALQLKKMKECRARKGRIECTVRKSFNDRPLENRILVSRSIFVGWKKKLPSYESVKLKRILDQIVQNQYLRINGKHYRLLKGLVQGSAGSISPMLCDIYYSEMDRLYLGEFMASGDCILLRGVDDYLLLTSDIEKATKFYDIAYNGIKDFNVTFNRSKLESNIHRGSSSRVNYLGLTFDVQNSSVKPDFTRYKTKDVLSAMKLSDPYDNMFRRRMGFIQFRSMSIAPLKLTLVTLNGMYNRVSDVRETVYAACVVQANRIIALTRHLTRGSDENELDMCVLLSKALRKISGVVTRLNRNVMKFEVSWLFWTGALSVCRKFSGKFPALHTVVRHRVEVLEKRSEMSGCHHLVQTMKREMYGWCELHGTLRAITACSKPSNRLR